MLEKKWFWPTLPLVVGLLTPSLIIFFLEVLVSGISPFAAIGDIASRQFSEGDNLYLIALVGLIPFVPLSLLLLFKSRKFSQAKSACLGTGGLLGILAVMVPGHVAVWYPLYGDGGMGSTAVLAFFFIPFYCLGSLIIGLLLGYLYWRVLERRQAL